MMIKINPYNAFALQVQYISIFITVLISVVNNGMRSSNGRGTVKRLIGMRPINRNFAADYAFLLKLYAYTKKAYGSCNHKKKINLKKIKLKKKLI